MKNVERIKKKLKQYGILGLSAVALRHIASVIDGSSSNSLSHQLSAHRVLSRYTSFEGKKILEVGGSQSCDSAYPFLKEGAASVIVTGLDHISQEHGSEKSNLRVLRADALKLTSIFGPCSFDVVYGLSIVEHITSPKVFLDQVHNILKPGGLAYFQGNPIWSSSMGHHLFVATWGGLYQDRTTANYLFSELPGKVSTNPIPDWSHLLMTPDQMEEYLIGKSIPNSDISCIIDWVFCSGEINRLNMSEIAEAYTSSNLIVLEATTNRLDVPRDILAVLRKHCGDGVDYGIYGVTYVLLKPG